VEQVVVQVVMAACAQEIPPLTHPGQPHHLL